MAYYITKKASDRLEKARKFDKDLHDAIIDLLDLIDGNSKCGVTVKALEEIGRNLHIESCRRVARALEPLNLPHHAKVVCASLHSRSPTNQPYAVLVHIPGPPPNVKIPSDIASTDITTVIGVGGVSRHGKLF